MIAPKYIAGMKYEDVHEVWNAWVGGQSVAEFLRDSDARVETQCRVYAESLRNAGTWLYEAAAEARDNDPERFSGWSDDDIIDLMIDDLADILTEYAQKNAMNGCPQWNAQTLRPVGNAPTTALGGELCESF